MKSCAARNARAHLVALWRARSILRHALGMLTLTLLTLVVYAEPSARIAVVLEADADEHTARRLRAELESLGFEVVETRTNKASASDESLEQAARAVGAFAAVRVAPASGGVEVWIADRVTGKTLLRELVVRPHESEDEIVALRAVELLRSSLLELGQPDAPRDRIARPPAPARGQRIPAAQPASKRIQPPNAATESLALGVGPLLAFSPGGFEPSAELRLGAHLHIASRLGAHVMVLLPTLPSTIEGAEGHADVSLALLAAGFDVSLLPPNSSWRSSAGLGAALIYLRVVGSAEPPYGADTDVLWLGAALGRFEMLHSFSRRIRVGAELIGGFTLSRVAVSFAERQVATWGQPFAGAGLVFEILLD